MIKVLSMAPSVTEPPILVPEVTKETQRQPLQLSGALQDVESFDVTPVIGREFPTASLAEWLRAPNSDELLRDLAITSMYPHQVETAELIVSVSQRGVVYFRKQDGLTDDLQKELVDRLGRLTGKPSTSGLHIHPISNSSREHSTSDDEISVISSAQRQKLYQGKNSFGRSGRHEWHSDITFEPVPSDYTLLRLTQLPKTGGGKHVPYLAFFV